MKILVVDDEPQIRRLVGAALLRAGYEVNEAATAAEALGMARSGWPDIVLLDLNLPDMNGTGVITALREWSQVPIIVLTARSANEDIVQALNCDFCAAETGHYRAPRLRGSGTEPRAATQKARAC